MVIELLTFHVPTGDHSEWLELEEQVWSRFLEAQPGFVRKEMWASADDPEAIHAVIWWESMALWKAISPETVAEIDGRMGSMLREPTMQVFDVVREC